ncbi:MAG: CapA family protein [Anaerolineaceae bacterium]|nr:CapA family protein [Anaerolineaceae bacterium]
MKKIDYLNSFIKKFLAPLLTLSMVLSACQSPAPIQAVTTTTTLPPPSPAVPTDISPSPTPTLAPLKVSLSKDLPDNLLKAIPAQEGLLLTADRQDADIIIEIVSDDFDYQLISYQVFVLAAPFFTIPDDITLAELRSHLTARAPSAEAPFRGIITEIPAKFLQPLISPKNPQRIHLTTKALNENLDQYWSILPFESLVPELKVISIDGISPLDDFFDPSRYALSLPIGIRLTGSDRYIEPKFLNSLLPESNFQPDHLTSLVMTGVTAMARETAFVMSTISPLYPGTNLRDTMRRADLTHISNEVSFFEGCPFPDPDYDGFIFCSDPEYIDLFTYLGADIIELTGNHNNDVRALYKIDTVPYTLDLYHQHGMQWYAGGTNLENAKAPLKIEHNGNKIAFVGCNSYGPYMAWATEDSSGSAPCEDWEWLKQTITQLKREGYLPIVTLQFQEDYLHTATSNAIRDFRPLAEAGAVIVNGSQSHVGKALEFYADALIHYGLGNLFFDQVDFYITYDGFIQKHFFYQGQHINTELLTITLEDTAKPRFMTPEERSKFLQKIFDASAELRSTA